MYLKTKTSGFMIMDCIIAFCIIMVTSALLMRSSAHINERLARLQQKITLLQQVKANLELIKAGLPNHTIQQTNIQISAPLVSAIGSISVNGFTIAGNTRYEYKTVTALLKEISKKEQRTTFIGMVGKNGIQKK